jgi:predicted metal-dependent phosphoesterase TrpH
MIDLHLHSTCSDGLLHPAKLVSAAKENGLKTIAICDHDTIAGVSSALAAGTDHEVEIVPGVELSVSHQGFSDIHLLGYFVDIAAPELLEKLAQHAASRKQRNRDMITAVNKVLDQEGKVRISVEEVEQLAGDVIGRPHIGRVLVAHGHVATMEEAFQHYLIPCNIPKHYWPLDDALATIHRIGGVAVLAHPTTITTDLSVLERLIVELHQIGLDGLEVYNSTASQSESLFLQTLANRLKLLVTGGSDFHGTGEGEKIGYGRGGIRFSSALLEPLRQRAAKHSSGR